MIENYLHRRSGSIFRTGLGGLSALPHLDHRSGELSPSSLVYHPYGHPQEQRHRKLTSRLVERALDQIAKGSTEPVTSGAEAETFLVKKNTGDLLAVQDPSFPPERTTSQLEIVTQPLLDGRFASSALEIKDVLVEAAQKAFAVAKRRDGWVIFASAPESGDPSQIELTQDPKILQAHARGQTAIHPQTPQEAREICEEAGLTDIIPFNGMHVHTGNLQLREGLYDPKTAYAAGILELTQMSQVASFSLFNTKHFLGKQFDNVRDIRSLIRRTTRGAHDTRLPRTARLLTAQTAQAIVSGETHDFSRHPVTGTHDRVRVYKDFGTTESVVGASNPDMRLVLAHIYFKQLMRVLSYQALKATGGDESQVISYLQRNYGREKYGYLFTTITTMDGVRSSFQQDLLFNKYGFDGKPEKRKSYREQMSDITSLMQQVGKDHPAFALQAKIVSHVFNKVAEQPTEGMDLATYLDTKTGMKGGIVTNYKGPDILSNVAMQAEGTEKQIHDLGQITMEEDLLDFFGIPSQKIVFSRKNFERVS